MTTAAMENLWKYIESLALSPRNRKWLAEKLCEKPDATAVKKEDPTLMTKEEFFERVEKASHGESHEMQLNEDLATYLTRRGYDVSD